MVSAWPVQQPSLIFADVDKNVEGMKELIRAVRNIRRERNVPPSRKAALWILPETGYAEGIQKAEGWFERLSYASEIHLIASENQAPQGSASAVCAAGTVYVPLGDLVDLDKEKARLQKELERLNKEIARGEGKLNNPGFVNKAPEKVVEQERANLAEYKAMHERVQAQIAQLGER